MRRSSINLLTIAIQSGAQLYVNRLLISFAGLNVLGLSASLIAIATFGKILDGTFSVIISKYIASRLQTANNVEPYSLILCVLIASVFSGGLVVPVFGLATMLHLIPNQLLTSFHIVGLIMVWAISTSLNTLCSAAFDALLMIKEKSIGQILGIFIQVFVALKFLPTHSTLDFVIIIAMLPGLASSALMTLILCFTGKRLKSIKKSKILSEIVDSFAFVRASKDFENITVNSIVLLGLEPTTKLFILHLGGPSSVAIFDIANQQIAKVRSIIISSMSYFLGIFASTDHITARKMAKTQFKFSLLACLFPFGILIANTSFLSNLFYGKIIVMGQSLILMAAICWFINTCTGPAHNLAMASNSKLALKSSIIMVALNLILGFASNLLGLDTIFSAAAYFFAIAAGSIFLNIKALCITKISSEVVLFSWMVVNSYSIPAWIALTFFSSYISSNFVDNSIVSALIIAGLQIAPAAVLFLKVLADFKANSGMLRVG